MDATSFGHSKKVYMGGYWNIVVDNVGPWNEKEFRTTGLDQLQYREYYTSSYFTL